MIDEEALKKELSKAPVWTTLAVKEIVENTPSIDIVCCIDCRYCSERGGHANCNGYFICTNLNRMVDESDYCVWGRRE